jgi:hypothetical protein
VWRFRLFKFGLRIALVVDVPKKFFRGDFMIKPMLISLSVLSALSFSSCGQSGDSKEAPVTTAQTTNRKSGTPPSETVLGAPTPSAPNGALESALDSRGGELSAQPGAPGQAQNPVNENGITIIEESGVSQSEGRGHHQGPVDNGYESPTQDTVAAPISSAVDLQFNEAEAVKTGGRAGELNYTSASRDGVMNEFRLKSRSVSADQQRMNQKLASAVNAAKLRRSARGEMVLDLAIIELDKKVHTYSMRAITEGNKMKLVPTLSGGDLEFQGGFLKCMDSDGGCQSAYAKIKFSGAYTRIIFRTSFADNHFVIYSNPSKRQNSNFNLWNSYIMNKVTSQRTAQKISKVQVSSYEIVNGKSAMGVLISADDQDAVGLSVGLLAPDQGTMVTAPVAIHTDISKSYDLNLPARSSQKLSTALSDVKLVANNGMGQLKLMFSFSQDPADSKIWMDLSRIEKSTMTVSDVQQFEATVPRF